MPNLAHWLMHEQLKYFLTSKCTFLLGLRCIFIDEDGLEGAGLSSSHQLKCSDYFYNNDSFFEKYMYVGNFNLCVKIFTCKHASEFFHEHTIFFEVANNSKFDQLLFLIELLQTFLLLVQVWFVWVYFSYEFQHCK